MTEQPPSPLWQCIIDRTRYAQQRGALQPIRTHPTHIDDAGINFLVRIVPRLARKPKAPASTEDQNKETKPRANPFLPYEEDLFVADISDTHVALLNKYNVIDHHLLIVTRAFEDQRSLINRADFEALWRCMAEVDGLGFYNGGTAAGASQPHKHLQLAPLPLDETGPALPIEPALAAATEPITTLPSLPFRHRFCTLPERIDENVAEAAHLSFERYRTMLEDTGLGPVTHHDQTWPSGAYNLLVTRRWMLLVPRTREHYDGISVNALGFAGSFFVRDESQLALIRQKGPMGILEHVTHEGPD